MEPGASKFMILSLHIIYRRFMYFSRIFTFSHTRSAYRRRAGLFGEIILCTITTPSFMNYFITEHVFKLDWIYYRKAKINLLYGTRVSQVYGILMMESVVESW